jgi:hypothetical protein
MKTCSRVWKFALCLLVVAGPATADTYLCLVDAQAGVWRTKEGIVESGRADPAKAPKWLLTSESGKWLVRRVGDDNAFFDKCTSEYFCENAAGFGGHFARDKEGNFTVSWSALGSKEEVQYIVAMGKCSPL